MPRRFIEIMYSVPSILLLLASCACLADAKQDYLDESLVSACWAGKLERARQLIARGANVNAKSRFGGFCICDAIVQGHPNLLQLLIQSRVNVNVCDKTGESPLIEACSSGSVEMVEALLGAGANPNYSMPESGETAMAHCYRGSPDAIVKMLLRRGARESLCDAVRLHDIPTIQAKLMSGVPADERGPRGATPLMIAVGKVNADVAAILLAAGADANASDDAGETVLMHHIGRNWRTELDDTVSLLIQRAVSVDQRDHNGMTALMYAYDNVPCIKALLDRGADIRAHDKNGRTVLMLAVDWHIGYEMSGMASSGEAVDFILHSGADVNARDSQGRTALLISCTGWQDSKTVSALLCAGANPNLADNHGVTPLMWAATNNSRDQISPLLTAGARVGLLESLLLKDAKTAAGDIATGADVNALGPYGRTPLMIAARLGDTSLARELLSRGARTDTRDEHGLTALHMAVGADNWGLESRRGGMFSGGPPRTTDTVDHPDLVKLLLAHGAAVDAPDSEKTTPLMWVAHWGLVEDARVLLNNSSISESTKTVSISEALQNNHTQMARLLLENGASPNSLDSLRTPLLVDAADREDFGQVSLLLAHRARVNLRDASGRTALIAAADSTSVKNVQALLAAGADPSVRDYDNRSALDYAIDGRHNEIKTLLKSRH